MKRTIRISQGRDKKRTAAYFCKIAIGKKPRASPYLLQARASPLVIYQL
jgi:hypothetical protein